MMLEHSKGVREKGQIDRKFSSTCGTRTNDLLLSGQAHYHCAWHVKCACHPLHWVTVIHTYSGYIQWLDLGVEDDSKVVYVRECVITV